MSPDWADKPEAVPYSDLTDPQSLNLYGYVRNNPLSRADADGHDADEATLVKGALELSGAIPEAAPFIVGGTAIALGVALVHDNWDSIKSAASSIDWSHYPTSTIDGIPMNQVVMNQDGAKSTGEPPQLAAGRDAHKNTEVRPGEENRSANSFRERPHGSL